MSKVRHAVLRVGLSVLGLTAYAPDYCPALRAYYDEGIRYELENGKLGLRLQFRSQFRYTLVDSGDQQNQPGEPDLIEERSDLDINRARIKLGGHVWKPWLEFYWENDLLKGRLLDLRAMIQPRKEIGLRLGQYKVLYNRERVESSGKQTLVERSIVNTAFTVDRQLGGSAVGHLWQGTPFDANYALGLFVGAGRDGDPDDSQRPMFVGRLQWNFLGRYLDYSSTDIRRRSEPAGSLALGAVSYRSAFTRYSTSGGGQLNKVHRRWRRPLRSHPGDDRGRLPAPRFRFQFGVSLEGNRRSSDRPLQQHRRLLSAGRILPARSLGLCPGTPGACRAHRAGAVGEADQRRR